MSDGPAPDRRRVPGDRTGEHLEESMLRGGLRGIGLVTAATVGVGLVAAILALVISAFY